MLYVVRTPDGLQQIAPDAPFVTYFRKVAQAEIHFYAEPGKPAPMAGNVVPAVLSHAPNALELWTEEDFDRHLVARVGEPATPEGKLCKGYTFTDDGDEVRARGIFEDLPVPEQVPKSQLYLALDAMDEFDHFEDVLMQTENRGAYIYFTHAHVIERNHSKTKAMFEEFGMTPSEIDKLFLDAAQQS